MTAPVPHGRRAIVVTGTPGTGKTAFSKKLAREIGADYVPLTQLVSEEKLYTSFDRERMSWVVNLRRVQRTLIRLLSQERGWVIVDTHIPGGIVAKSSLRAVFVLRCDPRILEKRLIRKKWKPGKVRENVLAELLDACLIEAVNFYGWRRVVQLDTSHTSAGDSVAAAKRILRHRVRRRIKVDWITTLGKESSLARYLKW